MATTKSSNAFAFNKINSGATNLNKRIEMDELMAILVKRQRAAVCLRGKGVSDDPGVQCGCIFCSPEAQREKFGMTVQEMNAQLDEEEASAAVRTQAREQTQYVRGMLAYERIRHGRRKSVAIRRR